MASTRSSQVAGAENQGILAALDVDLDQVDPLDGMGVEQRVERDVVDTCRVAHAAGADERMLDNGARSTVEQNVMVDDR